jgi:hypothetical protein
MRKTGLLIAIIVLLAGASALAQKKSLQNRGLPPIGGYGTVIVQDDNNAGYLVFDPQSGEYSCVLCEYGYTLSGKAEVKIDGCTIYFSDLQDGYRIFSTVSMCEQQAKCTVEMFKHPDLKYDVEPLQETWSDSNMRDNTADCSGGKK